MAEMTSTAIVFVVYLVILASCREQMRGRDRSNMAKNMREQEEARRVCLFLPLESSQGRRLGTCCVFPGRHRRFFGEAVLVRRLNRDDKEVVPSFDVGQQHNSTLPKPQHSSPTCDIHPLMLRDQQVGACCTFFGRFQGKPDETILPHTEEGNSTETSTTEAYSTTTIAIPESFDSRDFINSSCKKGYVLNANYECVMEF